VQEVLVARKIGGIESNEEYNKLHKTRPDAEFTILHKIQETTHKNSKNRSNNFRDLVVFFFKDDTDCEKLNWVKFETFDVGCGQSITKDDHHVFQAFNTIQVQPPMIDGPSTLAGARARARARVRARARQCARQGAWPVSCRRAPAHAKERGGNQRRLGGGWRPDHNPGIHYCLVHRHE
jgi:hypothetical protein